MAALPPSHARTSAASPSQVLLAPARRSLCSAHPQTHARAWTCTHGCRPLADSTAAVRKVQLLLLMTAISTSMLHVIRAASSAAGHAARRQHAGLATGIGRGLVPRRRVVFCCHSRALSTPSCASQQSFANGAAASSSSAEHAAAPSPTHNPFPLPSSPHATPYDVFHLPANSSSAEIKSRYYDLVKIYHPDRAVAQTIGGNDADAATKAKSSTKKPLTAEQAHEDFKRIREAYILLSSKGRRDMYDRSGVGWDPRHGSTTFNTRGYSGSDVPVWSGGIPRTRSDWQAYEAWSDAVRRGEVGSNRARSERQQQQQGHPNPRWFSGHDYTGSQSHGPRYTSNARFIVSLASLTVIFAIFQYARFKQERELMFGPDEGFRHVDAVRSLQEARSFAASEAGRNRLAVIRRRLREQQTVDECEREQDHHIAAHMLPLALPEPTIGHGGPSGKQAFEERLRRLEERGRAR